MQHQTVPQTSGRTSHLLGDAAQVALIRELITHARSIRAEHATYSVGNGRGQAYGPKEHTWSAGRDRVSVEGCWLSYQRGGRELLTAKVIDARDVGKLLAAVGVLPLRFIGGAK